MAGSAALCSLSFIGTATVLMRLGEFTVLTDPNFVRQGQWVYLGKGLFSRRRTDPAIGISQLPELDAVVLSHLHGDHFDRMSRRHLEPDTPIFTTPEAAEKLRSGGFTEAVPMTTWSEQRLTSGSASLRLTSLPGQHGFGLVGRLLPPVMGTLVEYQAGPGLRPLRIYLTGDTLVYDELAEIGRRFPEIDLAVVHLGGTRVFGALVTMDGRQGVDLLHLLRPRRAVPVHYDDYGVFRSPLSNFEYELRRRPPATHVRYLWRGDTVDLPVCSVSDSGETST
ncbi:MBL fold metallo-hydrolase [Goodfellowiella coeruleoviolacea]|uniref:L-ascorbate metabolism protein UlaG, beta-lactamase superfamily n=1 Tax=Goodfellowiella coeruleoviolacea TaxID=334858 RepID=A0AAE3GDX9_9PSEU|nr:MBL fold metallo-hydrolase [Goodfellowiella coeruleoviolacea]MCP2166487.1 L-ascorbate metabolism protein UlaG, beta-lactamase superfamily [Goodfellowiella coeruleoviolacea]